MIRISLGNVGSGKTANEVREISLNPFRRKIYTNIVIKEKKLPHVERMKPEYIIEKELLRQKKTQDGSLVNIYDYKLNMDFWKNIDEPICIVLDEFHNIANARASM
ncbi:MAG: hypothetical protein NTV63_02450 [Candidatus Woesearchaeota archaeon]|nr:hypothetical protein [Candidatus Woesearchaeota archaeon]